MGLIHYQIGVDPIQPCNSFTWPRPCRTSFRLSILTPWICVRSTTWPECGCANPKKPFPCSKKPSSAAMPHWPPSTSPLNNFGRVALTNKMIDKNHVQFGDASQFKGAMLFDMGDYQECVEEMRSEVPTTAATAPLVAH